MRNSHILQIILRPGLDSTISFNIPAIELPMDIKYKYKYLGNHKYNYKQRYNYKYTYQYQ